MEGGGQGGGPNFPIKVPPKNSSYQHLSVTRLRGYAVTHMLLYNQLYPFFIKLIVNLFDNKHK